jgi:late competence protein required for DNA uptake (superfamily II DNA/RNA helicase)
VATTITSIDVRASCPRCGIVDETTTIAGNEYCSVCLTMALLSAGAQVVEMKTIKVEREVDEEGHYLCAHCGKLTANGRTCQHCGR